MPHASPISFTKCSVLIFCQCTLLRASNWEDAGAVKELCVNIQAAFDAEGARGGVLVNSEVFAASCINVKQVFISEARVLFISITHCNVQIFNNPPRAEFAAALSGSIGKTHRVQRPGPVQQLG